MIRKSTWLVLCLLGLLMLMLGCKKKDGGLPIKTDVEPPPSVREVPPIPTGDTPPSTNREVPK